jgi:hypothetical protein
MEKEKEQTLQSYFQEERANISMETAFLFPRFPKTVRQRSIK